MKNTLKKIGVIAIAAVIGLSITACSSGDSARAPIPPGEITISGLNSGDSVYAVANNAIGNINLMLFAAQDYNKNTEMFTYSNVASNGKAVFKVWKFDDFEIGDGYDESHTALFVIMKRLDSSNDAIAGYAEVTFNKGKGTGSHEATLPSGWKPIEIKPSVIFGGNFLMQKTISE